jgi:hypothetical protein
MIDAVECGQEGVHFFHDGLIVDTLLLCGDTGPPQMIFAASII